MRRLPHAPRAGLTASPPDERDGHADHRQRAGHDGGVFAEGLDLLKGPFHLIDDGVRDLGRRGGGGSETEGGTGANRRKGAVDGATGLEHDGLRLGFVFHNRTPDYCYTIVLLYD